MRKASAVSKIMEKRKTTVVECKLGANCKCAAGENVQIAKCAQVVGLAGVEWDWGVAPLVSGRVVPSLVPFHPTLHPGQRHA